MSHTRRNVILIVIALLVVALVFVLVFFQPQKLFIDKKVDEAAPSPVPVATASSAASGSPSVAANKILSEGKFVTYAHDTTGNVTLIERADGGQIVRFTDFKSTQGPDVRVWLSEAPVTAGDDANKYPYVELGELKGNVGNQNYPVPASAANGNWKSVYVWCERFTVAFAAAPVAT